MWPFVFALLQGASAAPAPSAQPARVAPPSRTITPYDILAAEYQREQGRPVLAAAMRATDPMIRILAFRSAARSDAARFTTEAAAALDSAPLAVQREAMRVLAFAAPPFSLLSGGPLTRFRDAELRGLAYAAYGRTAPGDATAERALIDGLQDTSLVARRGVARGLEVWSRRTARNYKASAAALPVVRQAFLNTPDTEVRRLLLPTMTAMGLRDSAVVKAGLADTDEQVRRLAVILGATWVDDASPMVRWQALRVAGDCSRASALVRDSNQHVALLAIDLLGDKKCDASTILPLTQSSVAWLPRAHAAVALAKVAPQDAATPTRALASASVWQARAWAAQAARLLRDTATLNRLAGDRDPNVAIAALTTPRQAYNALSRDHAGLLMRAGNVLRDSALQVPGVDRSEVLKQIITTFDRITRTKPVTWRDARTVLLNAAAVGPTEYVPWMSSLLTDADTAIAGAAAKRLESLATVRPLTLRYTPTPFPSEAALKALQGATATIRMRGLGVIRINLLPEDAPATVHTFVTLAERGDFNGRTLHRVVSSFVLQGGSPGADEYDPATPYFMRDEVGGSHRRGTFGISTRGRDTGDGQLFINLVDNVRLDNDYTVFAETLSGLDVIDRIQEGNVIESITIQRKARGGTR
jgi:cyclophilin family peptidyl-prolyl cis-trans isomerase